MRKQELIDAAEASGLSRAPIAYVWHSFFLTLFLFVLCLKKVMAKEMFTTFDQWIFRPEKGKGKAGHFGSSPQDWYSGWSCMKTLISKGLVVKSSCPAKYGFLLCILALHAILFYWSFRLSFIYYYNEQPLVKRTSLLWVITNFLNCLFFVRIENILPLICFEIEPSL